MLLLCGHGTISNTMPRKPADFLLHPRVSDTASLQVLTDQVFELCHTWADAEQLVVLDRHVLQLFQPESCFFFKQSADEEFEFQEAGVRRGGGERREWREWEEAVRSTVQDRLLGAIPVDSRWEHVQATVVQLDPSHVLELVNP